LQRKYYLFLVVIKLELITKKKNYFYLIVLIAIDLLNFTLPIMISHENNEDIINLNIIFNFIFF